MKKQKNDTWSTTRRDEKRDDLALFCTRTLLVVGAASSSPSSSLVIISLRRGVFFLKRKCLKARVHSIGDAWRYITYTRTHIKALFLVDSDYGTFRDDTSRVSIVLLGRKIILIFSNDKLLPADKIVLLLVQTDVDVLHVCNLPFAVDGDVP